MNIAIFTDSYVPIKNGVVTSVLQLKEGLLNRGHKVIIITVDVPYYEEKDNAVFRLPSIKAGLGKGTEFRLGIVNQGAVNHFLKKKNIQLIHTHSEFSIGYCGKIAAKKLKIPHVHTTHTMWEEYTHYLMNGKLISKQLARKILRNYLKNVYAIIAPSVKAKNYYKQIVPNIPISIIQNGIDVIKFKSSPITENEIVLLRKEFGLKKGDKLIIFVGRIGKEKRVSELFDCVVPILKSSDNVKMIFVGDGPQLLELKRKAIELNLKKEFVFTGFVNWELVYRLYSISDLFVTCSLSEVHPMTLIEASMCGLSIIARYDESYLDLVLDGINGYLVEDESQMANKIKLLLEDNELLQKFKDSSQEISKRFTSENHVDRIEKLYEEILNSYPDKFIESNIGEI